MEAKEPTTFNNLPERVDFLISEVAGIKQILLQGIAKPEEIPKYLDVTRTLLYLEKRGISISRSKLYKMTAGNKVPYKKMDNKLYFFPEELDNWLSDQVRAKEKPSQSPLFISTQNIIKSSRNKCKK